MVVAPLKLTATAFGCDGVFEKLLVPPEQPHIAHAKKKDNGTRTTDVFLAITLLPSRPIGGCSMTCGTPGREHVSLPEEPATLLGLY